MKYLKSWLKLIYTVLILFSMFWFYACASVPTLVDQKLRYYDPCPEKHCSKYNNWTRSCSEEELIVDYQKLYCFHYCSEKSIFGNCQAYKMDKIDPNSPEIRSMGFRLRIPEN